MYSRSDRLTELLKSEIILIVQRLKDPRMTGILTITGVEMRHDLKAAKVFYSLLGTEEEKENVQEVFTSSQKYIRVRLRKRLRLKYIPEISFVYDDTPEKASRVFAILEKLDQERSRP